MLSIKILASFLLLAHIGSDIYIGKVLIKQWGLLKLPIHPDIRRFRKVLFCLSLAIFVGNIVPILIDVSTLFLELGRPRNVRIISILYACSNAIAAFISAYLIHTLYKLAADTKEATDLTTHTLEAKLNKKNK